MYALVKYSDDNSFFEVVPYSKLQYKDGRYCFKKGGCRYGVTITCVYEDELLLHNLLFNIQNNLPCIILDQTKQLSLTKTGPTSPLPIVEIPLQHNLWSTEIEVKDTSTPPHSIWSSPEPIVSTTSEPSPTTAELDQRTPLSLIVQNPASEPECVPPPPVTALCTDGESDDIWIDPVDDAIFQQYCEQWITDDADTESFTEPQQSNNNVNPNQSTRRGNRNKTHYCLYCGKKQAQIARHLQQNHKQEEDIRNLLSFPAKSKERNILLEKVRKLGDKYHNQKGEDIITVGATDGATAVICPKCNGYYKRTFLKRHMNHCNFSYLKGVNLGGVSRVLMANIHPKANNLLRRYIYPKIRRDDYFHLMTKDESLVAFGNITALTYLKSNQHHDKMVAQQLRLLSRIYLAMSANDASLTSVKDIINSAQYDNFVTSVKTMAGYTEDSIAHPTVMNAACNIIRRLATFLRCIAIKENNDKEVKIFDNFLYLLTHMQNIDLTKIALEKRAAKQRYRKIIIPTRKEIHDLLKLIDTEIKTAFSILDKGFDMNAWKQLAQMLLIYIMIFCRKRPGDIERLRVKEYDQISIMDGTFIDGMSQQEKTMAHQLARCVTRGKLNQDASILILRKHVKAIELLKHYREEAGVANNIFLWADPDKKIYDYFSAYTVLKNFCIQHKLDRNKYSATRFRYHLASSTSRMDKVTQGVISKFMGHEEAIHQKIYQRQPIQSDVLAMGEILFTCNGLNKTAPDERIQPITEVIKSLSATWINRDEDDDEDDDEKNHKDNVEDTDRSILPTISTSINVLPMEGEEAGPSSTRILPTPIADFETVDICADRQFVTSPVCRTSSPICRTPSPVCRTPSPIRSSSSESSHEPTPKKRRLPVVHTQRKSWETPERQITRELFKSYYEEKKLPSIGECLAIADGKLARGPIQIRNWIKHDFNRHLGNGRDRRGWCTPQKLVLRKIFRPYYEENGPSKYPPTKEINEAIETVPELKGKTTSLIRSMLQHDYKYIRKKHSF